MPRVVHCKKAEPGTFKYVGRPTKYGNPYSHKKGTAALHLVSSRDEAVEAFERFIMEEAQEELRGEIKHELRGWDLACWCAPLRCHAEVLLRIAND